jgi:hypothetical protein
MRPKLLGLLLLFLPALALAAGPDCPEKAKARDLFRQGKTDYELRAGPQNLCRKLRGLIRHDL